MEMRLVLLLAALWPTSSPTHIEQSQPPYVHASATTCRPQNGFNADFGLAAPTRTACLLPQEADTPTSSTPHYHLQTEHSRDESGYATRLFLRRQTEGSSSASATLTITTQTSMVACNAQVNLSYVGQAAEMALTGVWAMAPAHSLTHSHLHLVINTTKEKNLVLVVWDGAEQSFMLISSGCTVTLTSGTRGKAGGNSEASGKWDCGILGNSGSSSSSSGSGSSSSDRSSSNKDGRSWGGGRCDSSSSSSRSDNGGSRWWRLTLHGNRTCSEDLDGGRKELEVDYQWTTETDTTRMSTILLTLKEGSLEKHLLNITIYSSHKGWRLIIHLVPLHLILEAELITRNEERSQHMDMVAEIRNNSTGAALKFHSRDVTTIKPQESSSQRRATVREEDLHDKLAECLSMKETAAKPVPEEIQTLKQVLTSDLLNLKSNMTVYVTPAGSYIVRIHQIAQIPFCPPLGWSLNQIFNFSHDFSGWEYVVSQWEWGNMVVQGEFGSSPLEWYQKTFAFSLDQAAPLPSTHIILDFRDFSKFMLKVRWPTLATNLAASLNMQDGHYFLQVKKVDEFQGEEAGDVLVWVQGEETREGSLVVSWNLDTDKILALLTSAVTLLNQATSHPGMCGDTLDKHTFSQALQKLLGQNPACLWEKLLLQGHHLLGWVNGATKLQYLWKKLMEEHSQGKSKSSSNYNEDSSQQEVWEHIWTAAKMMGVLEEISESAKVVVVVTKRVQGYWNLLQKLWELVAENQGKCSVPYQLSTFIEELASQLKIFLPSQT